MKRKVLFLGIFSVLLLIGTLGICYWEVQRTLAMPTQDDIFGHTGAVFIMGIIFLMICVVQWELYRSLKYFLSDGTRIEAKNVSNGISLVLSAFILAISAVIYLFSVDESRWKEFGVYATQLTVGLLICNRLATGIYIERNTPWDENRWVNLMRTVKNVFRYVILIPAGFISFVGLTLVLTILGI